MKRILILFLVFISVSTDDIFPEEKNITPSLALPSLAGLEQTCFNKTGSNETFEKIIYVIQMVQPCIAMNLEIDRLLVDAVELVDVPKMTRVEFFNRYCPKAKTSLRCITQATDMIRKCIEPERIQLYETYVKMIPKVVELVCKDHGDLIFVDSPNIKECSQTLPKSLWECAAKISRIAESTDLFSYDEDQCSELDKVRQCYKQEFTNCRVPRIIELFDLFYRPAVKASPCKNFIKLDELNEANNNNI